jgi:hypothetical protein
MRLTSVSQTSDERFSEISVPQEKISPVGNTVTEHGTAERRLRTSDGYSGTETIKLGTTK